MAVAPEIITAAAAGQLIPAGEIRPGLMYILVPGSG